MKILLILSSVIMLAALAISLLPLKQWKHIQRSSKERTALFFLGLQEAVCAPVRLVAQGIRLKSERRHSCLRATRRQACRQAAFANIAEGTHEGSVSKLADAAIARYLLAKAGTDDKHVNVCGASEIPLIATTDEAAAAEDKTAGEILGVTKHTVILTASEAITQGEHVYTAASGKVQDLPAGAGTYYEVGLALTAASADGDLIEVASCVPRKTVVA